MGRYTGYWKLNITGDVYCRFIDDGNGLEARLADEILSIRVGVKTTVDISLTQKQVDLIQDAIEYEEIKPLPPPIYEKAIDLTITKRGNEQTISAVVRPTAYCGLHSFAGTQAESEECEDCIKLNASPRSAACG